MGCFSPACIVLWKVFTELLVSQFVSLTLSLSHYQDETVVTLIWQQLWLRHCLPPTFLIELGSGIQKTMSWTRMNAFMFHCMWRTCLLLSLFSKALDAVNRCYWSWSCVQHTSLDVEFSPTTPRKTGFNRLQFSVQTVIFSLIFLVQRTFKDFLNRSPPICLLYL